MNKKTKHTIAKKKEEEIINIISSHLRQYTDIYAAYLFGSFVTEGAFADIDLGVLLRREPADLLEYEIELERNLEKLVKFRLDIRVLNRAPFSFVQNVIRHGRVVVDREPNKRSDFENYALKKYFDFARFRQRYLEEVINAPI